MQITENEEIKDQKDIYHIDYELQQFIFNYENNQEKIVIRAFDKDGKELFMKEFSPKFINTHLNVRWQDKGVRLDEDQYEWKLVRKQ